MAESPLCVKPLVYIPHDLSVMVADRTAQGLPPYQQENNLPWKTSGSLKLSADVELRVLPGKLVAGLFTPQGFRLSPLFNLSSPLRASKPLEALDLNGDGVKDIRLALSDGKSLDLLRTNGMSEVISCEGIAQSPDPEFDSYFIRGETYFNAGDYERAAYYLKQAVMSEPSFEAFHALGSTSFHLQKYDDAIEYLGEAYKRATPEQKAAVSMEMGLIYLVQGKAAEGDRAFRTSLSYDPRNGETYQVWALAHIQAGRCSQGEEILKKGLKAVPGDPRLETALSKIQAGKFQSCFLSQASSRPF